MENAGDHSRTLSKGHQRTLEQARRYEDGRYVKRRRGQRLDLIDKAFAEDVLRLAGEGSTVLDVPCGSGRFHPIFSKAARLIMVDYSENMLKVARERYGDSRNVLMMKGNIASMALEDNSADLCFSIRFFHHLESEDAVRRVLTELARVSRKYVAISFYNRNCWRYLSRRIRGKEPTGKYYRFSRVAEIAGQAGLKVVEKRPRFNLVEQQCLVLFRKL